MSLKNSTLPDFHAIELNTFALDVLRQSSSNAGRKMPEISLSSLSFGEVFNLIFCSPHLQDYSRGGSAAASVTSIRILLLSTLLLYVSTATYMATILWVWSMSRAADGLLSTSYNGRNDLATYERALQQQSWILTIVMSLNFIIGDAVVWWRACVVWQHKVVSWAGPLLVTLTTGVFSSLTFTMTLFYFTYGRLVPVVAIYPTVIIVLVALKRSPIDIVGLSQVRQSRHGSGQIEGGTSSVVVFHHAAFRTSVGVVTESSRQGIPFDDHQSMHSVETSMRTGEVKDVGDLA
ncbi:hypothetical protein V8D89_008202 [Ganoderma adspersum]